MENASEITKIISAGHVSGIVNTMAIDGIVVDEDELMAELELLEDDTTQSDDKNSAVASNSLFSSSKQPKTSFLGMRNKTPMKKPHQKISMSIVEEEEEHEEFRELHAV